MIYMRICVSNLTIIGSDNGLSPDRRQAIICTNAGILLIGPLGTTNFRENLIGFQTFSFYKMHLKMSSAKWPPFCFGLNMLMFLCPFRSKHIMIERIINKWGISFAKFVRTNNVNIYKLSFENSYHHFIGKLRCYVDADSIFLRFLL